MDRREMTNLGDDHFDFTWGPDKGMEGRSVDFLYTICIYIATIHTDIVEKLTRSVEIVSQKKGHYFLNRFDFFDF